LNKQEIEKTSTKIKLMENEIVNKKLENEKLNSIIKEIKNDDKAKN